MSAIPGTITIRRARALWRPRPRRARSRPAFQLPVAAVDDPVPLAAAQVADLSVLERLAVAAWSYSTRTLLAVVCLVGVLYMYDSTVGDGEVPQIHCLQVVAPDMRNDVYANTTLNCAWTSPESLDIGDLEPTLALLRKLCPEAATFVRERHNAGKLRFIGDDRASHGRSAHFDFLSRTLNLHRRFFMECDGTKCAILLHEYRHSRQNYAKVALYTLSFLFSREGSPTIVERDAEVHEMCAYQALGMRIQALAMF